MELDNIRLHRLGLCLKIAVTCLILVISGGLAASVFHMHGHYRNKDEQKALSMDDITGSFHGVNQPARMLDALHGSMGEHLSLDEERQEENEEEYREEYYALIKWLKGNRISESYDSIELGDFAPAEIIAINCLGCHSRNASDGGGIGERVPLDSWDDVKKVAFSKNLDPVPVSILVTSTHTHALTMPLIGIVASLLFLATGWPVKFKRTVVMLVFIALLADIGSWWLAREWAGFCGVIVVSGGLFGGLVGLQLFLSFLSTWFGSFTRGS